MSLSAFLSLALLAVGFAWPFSDAARLRSEREKLEETMLQLPARPVAEPANAVGFHSRFTRDPKTDLSVTLEFDAVYELDQVFIVPAAPAAVWGYGFPLRYKVEAFVSEKESERVLLLDRTREDQPLPNGPVAVSGNGVRARKIRFTATRLSRQPNWQQGFMFCLGEIYAFSGGRNVALGCRLSSSGERPNLPTWTPANLVDGASALGLPVEADSNPTENINSGWHSAAVRRPDQAKWVQVDLGREYCIQEIRAIPSSPVTFTNRPGFGFPVRFRLELCAQEDFASAETVVDANDEDFPNPGNNLVAWSIANRTGRYLRFTATQLWNRWNDYVFALSELEVYSGGRNVARGAAVSCPDPSPHFTFQPEYLVDGRSGWGPLLDLQTWLGALATRAQLELQVAQLTQQEEAARVRDRRRWSVLAGIGLGALVLAAGFLFVRSRQQRSRELQALRQQIARDLHDEIGSSLGSIALISELGERDKDLGALEEVHRLASEAAESMRAIVWMIRDGKPHALDQLEPALRLHASQTLGALKWEFVTTGLCPAMTLEVGFHRNVFLFFKESLHNVVKHARTSQVRLRLEWRPASLCLEISDDGCGFDPENRFAGAGLSNMRHRAKALRAQLHIQSGPGKGTRITLEAPLT
jgi:signal transduction histidine kinase